MSSKRQASSSTKTMHAKAKTRAKARANNKKTTFKSKRHLYFDEKTSHDDLKVFWKTRKRSKQESWKSMSGLTKLKDENASLRRQLTLLQDQLATTTNAFGDAMMCRTCLAPMTGSMTLPCGHLLCRYCFRHPMQSNYRCGTCRDFYLKDEPIKVNALYQLVMDRSSQPCPNTGCGKTDLVGYEVDAHERICSFRRFRCSFGQCTFSVGLGERHAFLQHRRKCGFRPCPVVKCTKTLAEHGGNFNNSIACRVVMAMTKAVNDVLQSASDVVITTDGLGSVVADQHEDESAFDAWQQPPQETDTELYSPL